MNIYSTNYGVTVVIKFRINIIYEVVIYKIPKFFLLVLQCIFPLKECVYGYHYQQLLIELKHCKIKQKFRHRFYAWIQKYFPGKGGGGVVMETLFT